MPSGLERCRRWPLVVPHEYSVNHSTNVSGQVCGKVFYTNVRYNDSLTRVSVAQTNVFSTFIGSELQMVTSHYSHKSKDTRVYVGVRIWRVNYLV